MAVPQTLRFPTLPSDQAVQRSRKCGLKKDLITWLHDKKLGWTACADLVHSTGANFVAALTDCTSTVISRQWRVVPAPFRSNFFSFKATTTLRRASIGDVTMRIWALVCWIPMQACWIAVYCNLGLILGFGNQWKAQFVTLPILCLSMLHTSSKRILKYWKITEVWCLSDQLLMQRAVFSFREHNEFNWVLLHAIKPCKTIWVQLVYFSLFFWMTSLQLTHGMKIHV